MIRYHFVFPALLLIATLVSAQSPAPRDESRALFETIDNLDAKLSQAFNSHKTDDLMALFADDLEFYQDNDGLKNYQQCRDDFGKMFGSASDIKRELVKGSLEVYPIKDYGAIETGVHRFCHTENGQDECGTFKFLHVWRKVGDTWKISRVISYGH